MGGRVVGMIAAIWLAVAAPAFAEGFLDLYAGPSFTDSARVEIRSNVAAVSREVGFASSLTYGVRGGYWFAQAPWLGVGGDFSSQHARGDNARFDLTPLAALVLFRLPLAADEVAPHGRLQPYVGFGPSLSLYTYGAADFGPPTNGISDWGIDYGLQVPAGFALQLARHFALFTEYRYTWYRVKVENNDIHLFGIGDNVARELRTTLSGHNLLLGVSFRF